MFYHTHFIRMKNYFFTNTQTSPSARFRQVKKAITALCLPVWVRSLTSGIDDSHGVTGGVYKTRERIHRNILICDY